jgi:hypothetical protein
MASASQEKLYENFVQVAGEHVSSLNSVVAASQQLAGSLGEVVKQIDVTKPSVGQAPAAATAPSTSHDDDTGGGGALGVVGDIFGKYRGNLLGAAPMLVQGILSLFGGDDSPPEPALEKYVMPASIAFQAAESDGGFSAVDFDQMGQARAFGSTTTQARMPVRPETTQAGMPVPPETTPAGMPVPPAGQQITVHVQAMDARSFLDRSSEIAAAVRNAMLNLNSINDVVNDL